MWEHTWVSGLTSTEQAHGVPCTHGTEQMGKPWALVLRPDGGGPGPQEVSSGGSPVSTGAGTKGPRLAAPLEFDVRVGAEGQKPARAPSMAGGMQPQGDL